jgi:type I restriction enzyme, S subunit
MNTGLTPRDEETIKHILKKHPAITRVYIFGSRAKGNYKKGSDVDLAVLDENISPEDILRIKSEFDESDLPYNVDVIHYPSIKLKELQEHIQRVGKVFYERIESTFVQEQKPVYSKGNWKTYKLDEIATIQTGPFGSQLHQSDYVLNGTPIITVEHLGDNRIVHENLPCVSDIDKYRLNKYHLKTGDIVFSRVGSVDRRAFVKKEEDGWLFSGRCLRVRANDKVADGSFLSYFFGLETFKEKIRAVAVGATMPSLNTSIMKDIDVTLPTDIENQKSIASILSSLDDKIELNLKMNQTLEAMAHAIFKEWFGNFNFPSFDGKLVDGLPKGWKTGSVLEIANLLSGGTPKTDVPEYWNGTINWISAKDITNSNNQFIIETEKTITELGIQTSAAKLLPKFTTVVSARGTVGNYCILSKEMAISQSNYGLKSKFDFDYFLFLMIETMIIMMKAFSYGTVFDTITTKTFQEMEVTIPSNEVIEEFEKVITPLYEKILTNQFQIQSLTQIRDNLLPKLMTGKIPVNA